MRSITLLLATTLGLGTTAGAALQQRGPAAEPLATTTVSLEADRRLPPQAVRPDDPADSLYRAARSELARGNYGTAADLFGRIIAEHPASTYTPDAYYWRAFALYRTGGSQELKDAVRLLETQREQYPNAATRGDAVALLARIQGELARMGDADAAVVVSRAAGGVYIDTDAITETVNAAMSAATAAAGPAIEAAMAGVGPAVEAAMAGVGPTVEAAMAAVGAEMEAVGAAMHAVGGAMGARSGTGRDPCPEMAEENEMRLAALNALLQMDSERALPILSDVLQKRDTCSAVLRRKAVFLVAQKRGPETEELLLEAARSDPDEEVRRQAVFWLSQVPTQRALDAIVDILGTTEDAKLQERAIFALSQHESVRADSALRAYAANESAPAKVREKAIFWLAEERESPENAAFLRELFGRTTDRRLKERILFSVAQMKRPDSQAWLLEVAGNAQQPLDVRKKALFWAGESGAPIAALTSLYAGMEDLEMREQLIFVYSQRKEPAAFEKLLEIARTETEPRLRKRAIFWIGESKDPRAAEALQQIINQ